MTSDLFVLYMIGIAVISASVGILAAVAAPFCFRRLARSTLPVVVKKTGQGLLGLLLALVVLAAVHVVAMAVPYAHIEYRFDRIRYGMPISEVRRSVGIAFVETSVSLEEIEKDMRTAFDGDEKKAYVREKIHLAHLEVDRRLVVFLCAVR